MPPRHTFQKGFLIDPDVGDGLLHRLDDSLAKRIGEVVVGKHKIDKNDNNMVLNRNADGPTECS